MLWPRLLSQVKLCLYVQAPRLPQLSPFCVKSELCGKVASLIFGHRYARLAPEIGIESAQHVIVLGIVAAGTEDLHVRGVAFSRTEM